MLRIGIPNSPVLPPSERDRFYADPSGLVSWGLWVPSPFCYLPNPVSTLAKAPVKIHSGGLVG